MDNGPAAEQRFYVDYCSNENDYRFQDVEIKNTINEQNNDINIANTEELLYCKVNPIFEYSNDYSYYILNEYTEEMEIVNNITEDNYQNYLDTGLLYFTIQDETHATEILLTEYEGYTFVHFD